MLWSKEVQPRNTVPWEVGECILAGGAHVEERHNRRRMQGMRSRIEDIGVRAFQGVPSIASDCATAENTRKAMRT